MEQTRITHDTEETRMRSVVQAWADAKTRTGRTDLLVTVKQGQYRLKSIEFDARGHAKTTPITGFMTPADMVRYLDSL